MISDCKGLAEINAMLSEFSSVDEFGLQRSEETNENEKCISFEMFVEFMFRHKFSKGLEDDELLGLTFQLLLHKNVHGNLSFHEQYKKCRQRLKN